MRNRSDILIATLTMLRDRLAPVVDELLADEASPAGLTALAQEFELIAADLRHVADTPRVLDGPGPPPAGPHVADAECVDGDQRGDQLIARCVQAL